MKRVAKTVSTAATVTMALAACGNTADPEEGNGSAAGCALDAGKIEIIVPYSPGGGYDQYARQLAPALGEELDAEIIVINKPGAGGLLATNQLLAAEPDGTTIAIFNMTGHIGSALGEAEGVQYEPQDFSYIGRVSSEPDVVTVQAAGPHQTFDDLLAPRAPRQ